MKQSLLECQSIITSCALYDKQYGINMFTFVLPDVKKIL